MSRKQKMSASLTPLKHTSICHNLVYSVKNAQQSLSTYLISSIVRIVTMCTFTTKIRLNTLEVARKESNNPQLLA